ncbi:MAG: hypothetical protein ACOVOV_14695 [Dolichospermum sp.]|jgi:hypothetical protein
MTYQLTTNSEGLPLLIVNDSILFAWDPSDFDNYGLFEKKIIENGINSFAQLLADNPNTAFSIFTSI